MLAQGFKWFCIVRRGRQGYHSGTGAQALWRKTLRVRPGCLCRLPKGVELLTLEKMAQSATVGRDYRLSDYSALRTMGVASGYLAVLVLALYVDNPGVRENYSNPIVLWLLCPLMLYWISRLWIKTSRGEMHDDPLLFSLKDRVSWLVLLAMILTTVAAV